VSITQVRRELHLRVQPVRGPCLRPPQQLQELPHPECPVHAQLAAEEKKAAPVSNAHFLYGHGRLERLLHKYRKETKSNLNLSL